MSQLIQIKDFKFVALKDSVKITEQDKKSFLSMSLTDDFFKKNVMDIPTSIALIAEFQKCPFAYSDFVNDLKDKKPSITHQGDYVYVGPEYSVKSEQIPWLLQKAGIKIKQEYNVAYIKPIDNPETPYDLIKNDGSPFESEEMVLMGTANKLNIKIYDDILVLRHEEYERYLFAKKMIENKMFNQLDDKSKYLWALVNTFLDAKEKQDVVIHELKHAQNTLVFFDYLFDNPNCKLSPVDVFKYEQDDEISAKIAEVIETVNIYNQSENKNDLSIFESSYSLQKLLHDKNIDERKKLISDIPFIVSMVCKDWYKNYAKEYHPQLVENTSIKFGQIPLRHFVFESDGKAYNDMRKMMFVYNIYDAKSDKYVNMDLSGYLAGVDIDDLTLKMIQQKYQDKVVKYRQSLHQCTDKIQYNLLDEANQKYKKLVADTPYRRALADLQSKGMNYMSALNFKLDSINMKQLQKMYKYANNAFLNVFLNQQQKNKD